MHHEHELDLCHSYKSRRHHDLGLDVRIQFVIYRERDSLSSWFNLYVCICIYICIWCVVDMLASSAARDCVCCECVGECRYIYTYMWISATYIHIYIYGVLCIRWWVLLCVCECFVKESVHAVMLIYIYVCMYIWIYVYNVVCCEWVCECRYMYVYKYIYVYMYTYICICKYVYIYTSCWLTRTCIYIYMHIYIYMASFIYINMYAYIFMHMCTYMYIYGVLWINW